MNIDKLDAIDLIESDLRGIAEMLRLLSMSEALCEDDEARAAVEFASRSVHRCAGKVANLVER